MRTASTDERYRGAFAMTRQGSTGNVIAALCSFFAPGLGQLLQGRIMTALVHFLLATLLWIVTFGTMGWIMHLWSTISAARWRGKT